MRDTFLQLFRRRPKRIYLDHAAATPVDGDVYAAMHPYFSEHFGNPSAIHREGMYAREAVEGARERIARLLHIQKEGVVFTASGTESNNLAIKGVFEKHLAQDRGDASGVEIIATQIEHPSVLRVLESLERRGAVVRYARVDESGLIDEAHFASLLSEKTVLVTFAYANSEVGSVQNVKRLSRIVKKHNTGREGFTLTHLDASQAPLWLSCDMDMLGVDLMTLDAGKCYGPKGVGVLAFRHGVSFARTLEGGDQEFGLRGGTENTPLIVGCAEALVAAQENWRGRSERVAKLRDGLFEMLLGEIPGSVVNGSREQRIANNVNISIPGVDSEFAVVSLDEKGIAASTQSACSGAGGTGSEVVRVVSGDADRARSTIRFTLGRDTTRAELRAAALCLKQHTEKMQPYSGKDR